MEIGKLRNKVCFVATYALPLFFCEVDLPFGGAEVQMSLLALKLAENNKNDIVFVCGYLDNPYNRRIRNINIKTPFRIQTKNIFKKIKSFYLFIKSLYRDDSYVYVQRNAGWETVITCFIAKIKNRKFIYMVSHNIDVNGDFIKSFYILGKFFLISLRKADKIITQTLEQQEVLKKKFNINSVLIRNSCIVAKPCNVEKKYILWCGRIIEKKRVELFIEMARRLSNENFMLIGKSSYQSDYFKEIMGLAASCENIKVLNDLTFFETNKYFMNAKIFVNTSYWEGFPNTFLQAWQNGVPVLSFHLNPDNIITKNNIGVVVKSVDEAVIAVKDILSNANYYEKISKASYKYVDSNHNLNLTSRQLQKEVDLLCAE